MDWMIENWGAIVAAAVVLLSLVNAFATSHPDEVSPGVRRFLLLVLDRLSALTSKGAPIEPKLPLLERSARDLFRRRDTE